MNYRRLGLTGLEVAEICLGTADYGGHVSASDGFKAMDAYVEAGGNFLDTADIYSSWVPGNKGGESELVLGKWMKARKNRRHLVLATKVRGRLWAGPNGEGLNRKHIIQACEDSLKRLQTDLIDLYQTHWVDEATPIEETLRALDDLIRQGKVHYAGVSNIPGWRLAEAAAAAKQLGVQGYVSIQPYYNLVDRAGFEKDVLPVVLKHGLGVVPYSPLGAGFLTGKYSRKGKLPKTHRAVDNQKKFFNEKNFKVLDALALIARRRGKTVSQTALAWLLSHDWMSAPITSARNPDQIKETVGASGFKLESKEKEDLDRLSAYSS